MTVLDGGETNPVPMLFVAATVKVSAVPFANPPMVAVRDVPRIVSVSPPGFAVMV